MQVTQAGGPEVLTLADLPVPLPKANEALIPILLWQTSPDFSQMPKTAKGDNAPVSKDFAPPASAKASKVAATVLSLQDEAQIDPKNPYSTIKSELPRSRVTAGQVFNGISRGSRISSCRVEPS